MESALVVSGGVVHEPSNDVPVTSGVIAQWEAHEAYARSVLEVPTDDPGPVARQPRSWDPWGGQAPAGWVPWDASFRERLGILGETIQLQQENLAAARERWGQVYGNGYAAGTSAYSSEQVAAQASKVDSLHGQLRAVASLPGKPANELDRALSKIEAIVLGVVPNENAAVAPDNLLVGRPVLISGLASRPALNGTVGVAASFDPRTGRYHVRLSDGDKVALLPANLCASEADPLQQRGGPSSSSHSLCSLSADEFGTIATLLLNPLRPRSAIVLSSLCRATRQLMADALPRLRERHDRLHDLAQKLFGWRPAERVGLVGTLDLNRPMRVPGALERLVGVRTLYFQSTVNRPLARWPIDWTPHWPALLDLMESRELEQLEVLQMNAARIPAEVLVRMVRCAEGGCLRQLKGLYVSDNALTSESVLELAQSLSRGAFPALECVWLQNNDLDEAAHAALHRAAQRSRCGPCVSRITQLFVSRGESHTNGPSGATVNLMA